LNAQSFDIAGIDVVVNTHLHFDHCGGNHLLAGRPIYVQRREFDDARSEDDYAIREWLEAPGVSYIPAHLLARTNISPGAHRDASDDLALGRCSDSSGHGRERDVPGADDDALSLWKNGAIAALATACAAASRADANVSGGTAVNAVLSPSADAFSGPGTISTV
jgi:phosphoribosyl 1,2-cyclic phosphodiesterase